MSRALAIVLLAASTAHAGDGATAVKLAKKAGWKGAKVVATGTLVVVFSKKHLVLVDPERKKVLDLGAVDVKGDATIESSPFLGQGDLDDVVIGWKWSNGMKGGARTMHYVIRHARFQLACQFVGAENSWHEETDSTETFTVTKTADQPLTWEVVGEMTAMPSGEDHPDIDEHTFTLGEKGKCK